MASSLSINRLVNTSVNLTPAGAQAQNISTLLILGTSAVIDIATRMRTYTSLAGVATDFGTTAPEYLAAALWFAQSPQPTLLNIGRWANAATSGQLYGASLSTANQAITTWNAVTSGSFIVSIDGTARTITGLNFATDANLNAVAARIQAAINVTVTGATVQWSASYARFVFTSGTTGTSSVVSFLTTAGSGTDISGLLGGTSTSSGAYVVPGALAETALTALTLFDVQFGQQWYAVTIIGATSTDRLNCAAYIEAATTKHVYGISTQDANILNAADTTNIAYQLKQLGYNRSIVHYSSTTLHSVCSLLGRILTVNYNGNNTVITLMYKQEPGIVPETLNVNQLNALESFNCNVFVAYNNNTAIIEPGVCSSGEFIDIITGTDWLALDIQTSVYNLLYTSPTKIPQTDAGNHLIATTIENVCSQGVQNGLLAPGVWSTGGFGALNQGDFLPKGFYVYAPAIATQNPADRAARKSVVFQVAAKLAGAIQTVNVIINVNQ